MAHENIKLSYAIPVTEDWVLGSYFAIALEDGKRANGGHEASGIALGSVSSGGHMETGLFGIMKYKAGGATHTKGVRLTVTTSGWFVAATSGSYMVGTALTTTTSGSIGTGLFNFTVPVYAVDSCCMG